jgi:predicted polyphosphate/ATP-dependent NAD kinase
VAGREGTVGIIANPASGKDIRRLVARASVFDNQEKLNIVRRAVAGAIAGGARRFLLMPDTHGIAREATKGLEGEAAFETLDSPLTSSVLDTLRAAAQLRDRECSAVIVLGGDGTNRAVVSAWRDAPIVPISTGTNNVFPRMVEATVAGAAAGLVASGAVTLEEAAARAKAVHVEIDGERDDLALIDAALIDEAFVGSRAVWDTSRLRRLVLARADPASVGLSAIGGLVRPVFATDDAGLDVIPGPGGQIVRAPIAPGLFSPVPIASVRVLAPGETVTVRGPGILAFDGERERRLRDGQESTLAVRRDGPRVIDVAKVLQVAACRGLFVLGGEGAGNGA